MVQIHQLYQQFEIILWASASMFTSRSWSKLNVCFGYVLWYVLHCSVPLVITVRVLHRQSCSFPQMCGDQGWKEFRTGSMTESRKMLALVPSSGDRHFVKMDWSYSTGPGSVTEVVIYFTVKPLKWSGVFHRINIMQEWGWHVVYTLQYACNTNVAMVIFSNGYIMIY